MADLGSLLWEAATIMATGDGCGFCFSQHPDLFSPTVGKTGAEG